MTDELNRIRKRQSAEDIHERCKRNQFRRDADFFPVPCQRFQKQYSGQNYTEEANRQDSGVKRPRNSQKTRDVFENEIRDDPHQGRANRFIAIVLPVKDSFVLSIEVITNRLIDG